MIFTCISFSNDFKNTLNPKTVWTLLWLVVQTYLEFKPMYTLSM